MTVHLSSDTWDEPEMLHAVARREISTVYAAEAFMKALPMRSGIVEIQDTTPLSIAHLKAGEVRIGVQYAETALTLAEGARSVCATRSLNEMGVVLGAQKDSTGQDLARRIATRPAI